MISNACAKFAADPRDEAIWPAILCGNAAAGSAPGLPARGLDMLVVRLALDIGSSIVVGQGRGMGSSLATARFLWLPKCMARSTEKMQPKKRGRPATGKGTPVQVRLHDDMLEKLDAWCARQPDTPSRPEAIRRLVSEALGDQGT